MATNGLEVEESTNNIDSAVQNEVATTDNVQETVEIEEISVASSSPRVPFKIYDEKSIPDWADPELSEEWISQPASPVTSTKDTASDDGSAKSTTLPVESGTTRIVTDDNINKGGATPEWKKITMPKDIFSPLSLERMFKPSTSENTTGSKTRGSKDSHARLQASFTKLKSELEKVSPIRPLQDSQQENRFTTTRNSLRQRHQTLEKQWNAQTIDEEPSDEGETGVSDEEIQRAPMTTEIKGAENSPHPPQQQNFNFTVPKPNSSSGRLLVSPSKLRLFQNRDTFTTSRFERLIETNHQPEPTPAKDSDENESFESETNQDQLVKPMSPWKERNPKRARLDMSKAEFTTQDFMSQAEHVMDMIRSLKNPADPAMTDDEEFSQRQSEMNESSQHDLLESISESPQQKNHKYAQSLSSSAPSDSERVPLDSNASRAAKYGRLLNRDGNEGHDEDVTRHDRYYNSVKGRYETSSTQMGMSHQQKRSVVDMGLSPLRTSSASVRPAKQKSTSQATKENTYAQHSPTANTKTENPSPSKARKNTASPKADGSQLTPVVNSSNKRHSANQKEPMKVILKSHVEKLIPGTFGSMVFDYENNRWVKKGGNGVNVAENDEEDVFKGIDDLFDDASERTDESQAEKPHEVFIEEYRNSLQRSLSSLEENLGGKSGSTSRSRSPQKKDEARSARSQQRQTKQNHTRAVMQPRNNAVEYSGNRPEVSFAFPALEHEVYGPDISYVGARHDATAVSQLESSFSIAVQNLVKVLTDIQPFEIHWEDLLSLDLRNRELETLVRLEEWCPRISELVVSKNHLAYLTGAPESTRILRADYNNLSELTAFGFLSNLQYLDLSHNHIESLDGMSRLVHLRELIVDHNEITNIDGVMQLDGLLRLSARGNHLETVSFDGSNLKRLEDLDLSSNKMKVIEGLESLKNLMLLNLSDNSLQSMDPDGYMTKLRTLKISNNSLGEFDASAFPNLRVLYLDDNKLRAISGLRRLRFLENLSIRDQHNATNEVWCEDISDVRKLYLSGNIPKELTFQEHFLNLQCLELASVQLKKLPDRFSVFASNLRDLNLSFNELSDLSNLKHIQKLRRLYIIGNQLKKMEHLAHVIATCPSLQVLDMRMNPLTLQFYPPVLGTNEKDKPDAESNLGQTSLDRKDLHRQYNLVMSRKAQVLWEQKNKQFSSHLPRLSLVKRKAYQGLMFMSAPNLQWLDGASFTKDDIHDVSRVLEKVTANIERGR